MRGKLERLKSIPNFFTWNLQGFKNHRLTRALPYWFAAVLVGLISTIYSKLFHYFSEGTTQLYSAYPKFVFIFAPLNFFLGWFLVRFYAPTAGGSGIPQVLLAIELDQSKSDLEVSVLLRLRVVFIKILSSVFGLLGGGALGREGPTLQISASIFYWVGTKSRFIWPKSERSSWLIAGGAAGIASAFNTPLGGIVYAIEELASVHFHKFKTAALSAVIISGVIAQAVLGTYLYLGYPILGNVTSTTLALSLVVGATSGSLGSLFGSSLFYFSNMIRKRVALNRRFLIPLAAGVVLASLFYFVDVRAIGPGSDINADLLSGGSQHSSFLLVIVRFLSSLLSYLSGCAGGIFAPSLAIGASIGAEISKFVAGGQENILILLGMIGFLTSVTHCPFTSFVLVMEMTDRHSAVFPMMLTALVAHSIAKTLDGKSFYEKAKIFYTPKS